MNSDKTIVDNINASLLDRFRVLDGRPMYRIVWSDHQLEMRKGKFTDWYGHIFIREVTAVRQIKKYWYLPIQCWVLEKLVFIKGNAALKDLTAELVEAKNGTYETVYPFCNPDKGITLPVSWPVVEFILHNLHNPGVKLTESDVRAMELEEEKNEADYFYEKISDEGRSNLFAFDLGMNVSTKQLDFKKNRQKEYVENFNVDPNPIIAPQGVSLA